MRDERDERKEKYCVRGWQRRAGGAQVEEED